MVTGEVGTGKTTLVQELLETLDDDVLIGLISNAQGSRGDLLRWVMNSLNIPHDPDADYVALFQVFQDFVIEQYADGRHVILVIDEAQNLSVEALEELRMYTNINARKHELLQVILVGQPELRTMVEQPELRQFAQRVTATYHINPMDLRTTKQYIAHRLICVGGDGEEFTGPAMTRIYEETGGIPRLVNKLCDLALVYASSDGKTKVGTIIIRDLIQDGLFINMKPRSPLVLFNAVELPGEAAQ